MPSNLSDLLNPLPMPPAREEAALTKNRAYGYEPPLRHKRMGKACTQCRRDKSRCDNERPCNGCRRKGRAQLCVDGCYRCRHEKLSCDDKRPCHRCVEQGVECSDTRTSDFPLPKAKRRRRRRGALQSVPQVSTSALPSSIDSSVPSRCKECQRQDVECLGSTCSRFKRHDDLYLHVMTSTTSMTAKCGYHEDKMQDGETRPCSHCVHYLDCDDDDIVESREEGEVQKYTTNPSTTRLSYTARRSPVTPQTQGARTSSSATPPSQVFSSSIDEMDSSYQPYAPRAPSSFHRIPSYAHTLPSLKSLNLPQSRDSAYTRYDKHRHYNVLASPSSSAYSSVALPSNEILSLTMSHIRSTAEHSC